MSTLYYNNESHPHLLLQRIVAGFAGVTLNLHKINSKSTSLAYNNQGVLLQEANSIAMSIAEGSPLLGNSFEQEVNIYSWIEFTNVELLPLLD